MLLSRFKTVAINALLAFALLLMLVQAFPGTPYWFGFYFGETAKLLGVSQHTWSMFFDPDHSENHRLRAHIEYYDGHTAEWESPVFREQSTWQRFVGHRHSEYYDAVSNTLNEPALKGLAEWLMRTHRKNPDYAGRGKRIEIFKDVADIKDPRIRGWTMRPKPGVYDHTTSIFEEECP